MRRITLAIAAGATGAALVLTGCGSSSPELGPVKLAAAEALQESARKAEAVTSYTVDAVVAFTGRDAKTGRIQGRMLYQSSPQLAADLTVDTAGYAGRELPGGARVVLLGDTVYVKVNALKGLIGSDKPWVKASVSDLDAEDRAQAEEMLGRIRQFDLAAAVRMITTSKDVKAVGTETVGGVETTHYSGTFPVDAALAQLDPDKRERAREDLAHAKDMTFDLWADGQGLPRKIALTGGSDEGSVEATMLFKGFNEPVDITAPPADQVGDLPKHKMRD